MCALATCASPPSNFASVADLNAFGSDKIDLSGFGGLTQVSSFDGHANEMTLTYDSAHNLTLLAIDNNGDTVADAMVHLNGGDFTAFTDFVL
jgi:hypothetical protein